MCGIYCFVTYDGRPSEIKHCKGSRTRELLERRGPDRSSNCHTAVSNWHFCFEAHVLWMQGHKPVPQPIKDEFGNTFLWNGDIFGGKFKDMVDIDGIGDTSVIFKTLVGGKSSNDIIDTLSHIRGPWSMVYWDETKKMLWFGRDALGRHSLLRCQTTNSLILTSVAERGCHEQEEFVEVPAIGVFSMDFSCSSDHLELPIPTLYMWSHVIAENVLLRNEASSSEMVLGDFNYGTLSFFVSQDVINSPFISKEYVDATFAENKILSPDIVEIMPPFDALKAVMESWESMENQLDNFIELLKCAVKTRVQTQPGLCKDCLKRVVEVEVFGNSCKHPKICILFSGGIDSTILALLSDKFIPEDEAIDLLNVAFAKEKTAADNTEEAPNKANMTASNELQCGRRKGNSQIKNSGQSHKYNDYCDAPDRKTGKQALLELKMLCPSRNWNYVEIDVPVSELEHIRQDVISDLIHPLNTVLDDSLGCALWFAARGAGKIAVPADSGKDLDLPETGTKYVPYVSPARVALLGTGADEQLGGYSRHRSSLEDGGWPQLTAEMIRQVRNLPSRNLGRDDRICSDHGRQPRFPFLDESIVSFLSSLPPWRKVCANTHTNKKRDKLRSKESSQNSPTSLTLRPGVGDKALLRLAALKLGLRDVCTFPKRAMQFGTHVAKLEATGKEKANDICERLKTNKIKN